MRCSQAILLLLVLGCGLCFADTAKLLPSSTPATQSPAAVALFVNSNPDSARTLAGKRLQQKPSDLDALFVLMESAALEADTATELDAALRLCETNVSDPRVTIAAARVLDLSGNTIVFRASMPRLQKLAAADSPQAASLRLALVTAAAEGAPTSEPLLQLARHAGLLTEWQVAGPFGRYANVAFDHSFAPEYDGLSQASYDGHAVERFRFDDGAFLFADYFSPDGVYYATSRLDAPAEGTYHLRMESSGTLQVFVDGTKVQSKDDRLRTSAGVVTTTLHLTAGGHRVLVKFVPSAAPFRIAVLPAFIARPQAVSIIPEPEAAYVRAAERFWVSDYSSAIARLADMNRLYPSSAVELLLAHAWSQLSQDAPEIPGLLESALKRTPLALAAEYEVAQRAYDTEHNEEAYTHARRIAAARPEFAPAQQLLADIALRMNWPAEAEQAFEAELRLHPSCETIRGAAKFYASIAAYDRAAQLEKQLDGCEPGSLAYAHMLSKSGRHAEAAACAEKLVREYPLNRDARQMLARELASAGDSNRASAVISELTALAPNASRFRQLETASLRARAFLDKDFYETYRRDGLDVVRQAADRHFSGGPAVILLDEHVARLRKDGSVSLYVHNITRVLNRDGIEKYGEVALPASAELLELRTIKQDGTVVEPEFSQHKTTVSMPALAAGDAIEQEYVVRHEQGGIRANREIFQYTFGSFAAPILQARFVAFTPEGHTGVVSSSGPAPRESTADGVTVRVWQEQDIAQSAQEASAPRAGTLPQVRILESNQKGWHDLRDSYRDQLIAAVQTGPRVEATARELRGATPEDTARNLYRLVTTRVRSTESEFDGGAVASAEETLANYAGSRTTALLALARAEGLQAELLLAREIATRRSGAPEPDVYSHPVVLFHLGGKDYVADAETAGLAFGVVPSTLSREDALSVPVEESSAPGSLLVALPASAGDDLSTAEAEVSFDPQGNLKARLTIRMGASRGSQMRSVLNGIDPAGRKRFFEQLALRIFPGVSEASGEVENEYNSERTLSLIVNCRAPRFLTFNSSTADIEQLAPALGLRRMYGLGPRHLPLYIDMPLVETTVFHVHLPEGFKLTGKPSPLHLQNEFGSYTLEFKQTGPREFDVVRAFRIPVQVVPPERFDAFAKFARQIDDAERQRLAISTVAVNTARQ